MASGSHGGRAAAAFGAIGLLIVTLGINISANSISAANDLMSFLPKYINIRRGQLIAAVIGSWAFVPVRLSYICKFCIPLTVIVVENSCFRRKVPCFPRWLHHFPRSHDLHPDYRVCLSSIYTPSTILIELQLLYCSPR